LHDRRQTKKGLQYLVEWDSYEEKTWEKAENIPQFIRTYFDRTGNKTIPSPRIKKVKHVGSKAYYLLTWDDKSSYEEFVPATDFIIDEEEEKHLQSYTCNTRKHHGARYKSTSSLQSLCYMCLLLFYRYCRVSAGIMIGCYPCGVVTLFGELFGSESISQVYGHVCEWYGEANPEALKYLLYDDACHLVSFLHLILCSLLTVLFLQAPYAQKEERKIYSDLTQKVAGLKMFVDKLHFPGHVGAWCHKNCNPFKEVALQCVNTPICEQSFRWLNAYKQVSLNKN
jgi:hypothetical protein